MLTGTIRGSDAKPGRVPKQPTDYHTGSWWRSSRYVIADGYIRPAPGSQLNLYDPWAGYWDWHLGERPRRTAEDSRTEHTLTPAARPTAPYESLLRLVDGLALPEHTEHPISLSREQQRDLLDWCARYGLLGVLLQNTQRVVLVPRWRRQTVQRSEDIERTLGKEAVEQLRRGILAAQVPLDVSAPTNLVPVQREYARGQGADWITLDWPICGVTFEALGMEGEPISVDTLPVANQPCAGSLNSTTGVWTSRPLTDPSAWTDFFPGVPPDRRLNYEYPSPSDPDFWIIYGEPVDVFLQWAFALSEAITAATPPERGSNRPAVKPTGGSHVSESDLETLNQYVNSASPAAYRLVDGTAQQRWVAPSLFASFAMMALQQATGHFVRLCKSCGRPFQKRRGATHCSDACRDKERKARNRDRKRNAR